MAKKYPIISLGIALFIVTLFGASYTAWKKRLVTPSIPQVVEEDKDTIPRKLVEDTKDWSINVMYPRIEGEKEVNQYLYDQTNKAVAEFKIGVEEVQNAAIERGYLPDETMKSTFSLGFSVEDETSRYVSLLVTGAEYSSGAAHPLPFIITYVFDKKTKRFATLSDLFIPGSNYLKTLSDYARADLRTQSHQGDAELLPDTDMIDEGTTPNEQNFSRFLPVQDGLMIYFPVYQVAPYAAGNRQVAVKWSALSSLLSPSGVVGDKK